MCGVESRDRQFAASSTPQQVDLSACGTQELDSFQKGKSRGKRKDKYKPKDNLPTTPCPICGKVGNLKKECWYNIPDGWDEANKTKDKSKGKDGKDKISTNTQQQSNNDKKNVKFWNCNGQGHYSKDCPKKKQSLSVLESQEQASSSGAFGETTLSGFFLFVFEKESDLNSFESKIAGVLVIGIDSVVARSVVVVGEILGYPVERDSRVLPESACSIRGNSRFWELWTAKCEA